MEKNPHAVALGKLGGKIGGRITGPMKNPRKGFGTTGSKAAVAAVQERWRRYREAQQEKLAANLAAERN